MSLRQVWGSIPLAPTWSLAVEEQFYLTLPLLIRLLSRRALLFFLAAAITAAPLLRIFFYHRDPVNFFTWYTLMPCRADALLLGVLAAIAVREPLWRSRLLANRKILLLGMAVLLVGVAFLGWRAPSYRDALMATIGFSWMALFFLASLLYGVLFPASRLSRCLRWTWLRGLGLIAYGTYLFQEFFLGLFFGGVPWLYSFRDVGLSFLTLLVTLFFCRLSWVYFEKPLVKLGHRLHYQFHPAPGAEPPPAIAPPSDQRK